ncbi:hypothetical protein ACH5RR_022376 [Cinchona calisaya]|uniref:Costars domain-containing protein n=1 Tax=Cinchona calisaya TaxID=153742 RepID=A0ABD2Z7M6_9GENT
MLRGKSKFHLAKKIWSGYINQELVDPLFQIPIQLKTMNVEEEVERLKEEIKRLGKPQDDGSYKVTFGVLFNDDRCANIFEALVGTLRAGKKRKVLTYDGELLLQGVHNNVEIILKPTLAATSAEAVVKS